MTHLDSQSDIARRYSLTIPGVIRWRKDGSFPAPFATYGASKRPLYDPAAVDAWVRSHRPEYAQAGGEVRA
ncbi:hypothetical protein [Halomonas stenophila]|uniref:DNA-binding protein n=1 Tax=Halomonas stenophila TaxID=795312 RepID=A0A7W5HLF4_9GAMM|nr:hypothetical protein [Halomonas stenophila]MBB3231069.1 hypothetical protein [Halomonas stenophila]